MHLSTVIDIIAEESGAPRGRIEMLARRLADINVIPKSKGGSNKPVVTIEHAVLLILAHLSGEEYRDVAGTVLRMEAYRNERANLIKYLVGGLRLAVASGNKLAVAVTMATSLSVVRGPHPAVVVRLGWEEEPRELAFTPGGIDWTPHRGDQVLETRTMPGFLLLRIARALAPLFPAPIEYRTFPFTVESVS